MISGSFSMATIASVARGPKKTERKNQFKPLLPLPWAIPALIKANVPQPTKNWLLTKNVSIFTKCTTPLLYVQPYSARNNRRFVAMDSIKEQAEPVLIIILIIIKT